MSFIPRQMRPEKRDTLNIRLDREVSATLNQYMEFIESGRDYVIGQGPPTRVRKGQGVSGMVRRTWCRIIP